MKTIKKSFTQSINSFPQIKLNRLIYLLMVLGACDSEFNGKLKLINNSDFVISTCVVKVDEGSFNVQNIKVNETVELKYSFSKDCSYDISITFLTGKRVSKKIGYMTQGFYFEDIIIIESDTLTLERIKVNSSRFSDLNDDFF